MAKDEGIYGEDKVSSLRNFLSNIYWDNYYFFNFVSSEVMILIYGILIKIMGIISICIFSPGLLLKSHHSMFQTLR